MDAIHTFNDELQSLVDMKPPVSKAKMGLITRAAMKGVKYYKHVVQSVEKFIARCTPEYKIPGLYVIDSIVRQSRHQFGIDRDVYAARFSRNLQRTFSDLFSGCQPDDKQKIVRVLNLWQKNGVFDSLTIQPLLDMANPNSSFTLPTESTLSADSPTLESGHKSGHKFTMQQYKNSHYNRNSSSNHQRSPEYDDYDDDGDDDDGDETPTEAEPPLSSTLNKIEMEHRSRNDLSGTGQHPSSHLNQRPTNQANTSNQDSVVERWNRLVMQQSITSDNSTDYSISETARRKRSRSRSRSRSPPPSKERFMTKNNISDRIEKPAEAPITAANDQESEAEKKAERKRKCLPEIRDKHLTVCSTTLWLGHVPKTVSEADISDAFGEYGSITSIDLIPPRGCAYVCMDRRQDAKKALSESRDLRLNGSHVKLAWAPGKGLKEYKKLKEFWEVDIGASYIPYAKVDPTIDFDVLEDGGVIDEDSMSTEMREKRDRKAREKEVSSQATLPSGLALPLPVIPLLNQPPPPMPFIAPPTNLNIPPPTSLNIPPPSLGGIHFPPPMSSVPNHVPPPPPQGLYSQRDQSREKSDQSKSPNSIDHQLSLTERQISMVEQQLNMIQQQQQRAPTIFQQNQPNPMIFDMSMAPLLHSTSGQPMIDHNQLNMAMFANPDIMSQGPLLPVTQANMNLGINGNGLPPFGGRF